MGRWRDQGVRTDHPDHPTHLTFTDSATPPSPFPTRPGPATSHVT